MSKEARSAECGVGKPKRGDRIVIEIVRRPKWIGGSGRDNQWEAREIVTGRKGTSLCNVRSAVDQCARNYFFGGSTKAFVRGRGDQVTVRKRAGNDGYSARWEAA